MEKNLPQSARKTRLHARNWEACPLCAEVARTPCAHFGRELGTTVTKNSKMAGDTHVFAFFWFQRFVAFISSNGKYSIVSILFLLDVKYVGILSVALCLDRGLSLIMSPGIIILCHCQGLWFLVSYNYFHRFLDILSWLISTSFYLNRFLGSSTVAFIVFFDFDCGWGEGVTIIYMGSMIMCCYGEYRWGNGFEG